MVFDMADGYLLLAAQGSTWSFEGGQWRVLPGTQPPPVCGASLAYDPTLAAVVRFGGIGAGHGCAGNLSNQTWAFARGHWNLLPVQLAPSARAGASLAYDAVDSDLILFGGANSSDTWALLGTNWTRLGMANGSAPAARSQASMAYDARDGELVLFGGVRCFVDSGQNCQWPPSTIFGDTWTLDDGRWTNVTALLTTSPGPGYRASASYDPADGAVLLAGGFGTSYRPRTHPTVWEFSGEGWSSLNPPNVYAATLANDTVSASFDGGTDSMAFFVAGATSAVPAGPSLIEYSDGHWTSTARPVAPPQDASSTAMTYDAADGYVLLYEPSPSAGVPTTWKYSQGAWSALPRAGGPPHAMASSMAYDGYDREVVMFGGDYPDLFTMLNTTWAFRGGSWTEVNTPANGTPPGLADATMTYDSTGARVVMFGGLNGSGVPGANWYNATWTYRNGSWTNISNARAPFPRAGVALGDAPSLRGVLLFGGENGCEAVCDQYYTYYNDTWLLRGQNWTNVTRAAAPPAGEGAVMTTDPTSGAVALVGGTRNDLVSNLQLWTFNGTTWADWPNATAPSPQGGALAGMGFVGDPADGTILMFGGGWYGDLTIGTWGLQMDDLTAAPSVSPSSGTAPVTVSLNAGATSAAGVTNATWTFGDGTPNATGLLANHTFRAPGMYDTKVHLVDRRNESVWAHVPVDATSNLTAQAVANTTLLAAVGNVSFQGTIAGGVAPYTLTWTYGDGTPAASGSTGQHRFGANGTYLAEFRVRDAVNATANAGVWVQIGTFAALGASIRTASLVGDAPFSAAFHALVTGGSGVNTYLWSFGDGTNSTDASPTHNYPTEGRYLVSLAVRDSSERFAEVSLEIEVYPRLQVNSTVSPVAGYAPLSVQVHATISGGRMPYRSVWSLGDGLEFDASNGLLVYAASGAYNLTLAVTDGTNRTQFAAPVLVTVEARPGALVANLSVSPEPDPPSSPLTVVLSTEGGLAPDTVAWSGLPPGCDAGDVTHFSCVPTRPGNGSLTARVTDAFGDVASVSAAFAVEAVPLHAQLIATPGQPSIGESFQWEVNISGGLSPYAVNWSLIPFGCRVILPTVLDCALLAAGSYAAVAAVRDSSGVLPTVVVSGTVVIASGRTAVSSPSWLGPSLDITVGALAGLAAAAAISLLSSRRLRRRR